METVQRLNPLPELLITDVVLPGMSGPELASRLEQHVPGLKILLISGFGEGSFANSHPTHRRTPFIQKPFALASLTQKVADVLSGP